MAAGCMDHEHGWVISVWLDRHKWRPGRGPRIFAQKVREIFDSGALKQRRHRDALLSAFFDAGNELHYEQRMAAQLEEIIRDADRMHVQQLFPYLYQLLLQSITRRYEAPARSGERKIGYGKSCRVNFPILGNWHPRHKHKNAWN